MTKVLKTEWSTEEILKEAKESYGHGIFLCGFAPKWVYVPLSNDEMISLDGLLDDFESNYFMLYEQGLSIIPIDPDSRDKTRAERESFLSEVSVAQYLDRRYSMRLSMCQRVNTLFTVRAKSFR